MFLKVENSVDSPLLQLTIFKNQLFSLSIFCGFLLFVAMNCSNIIMPFYLQDVIKLSPSVAGLYLMTYPLVLFVVAPISGHISDKIGSELLTFIGLIIFSSGFFFIATLNEHFEPVKLVVIIAVMALGNGMFQSPNNSLVMSSVPRERVGVAGSINALVRNLGLVVGVSVSTLILYGVMSSKLGYSVTTFVAGKESEFIFAMRVTYICAGLISFIGAALTAFRLIQKRRKGRPKEQ
jgi:MFS family permease